jgi:hypothetical protein
MLEDTVRALWADVRGVSGGKARSSGAAGEAGSGARPNSKLFRCPDCEVVYLALEKESCSSCRGEVTEVSPTLTDG